MLVRTRAGTGARSARCDHFAAFFGAFFALLFFAGAGAAAALFFFAIARGERAQEIEEGTELRPPGRR